MSILSSDVRHINTELSVAFEQVECALHIMHNKENKLDLDDLSTIYILEGLKDNLSSILDPSTR